MKALQNSVNEKKRSPLSWKRRKLVHGFQNVDRPSARIQSVPTPPNDQLARLVLLLQATSQPGESDRLKRKPKPRLAVCHQRLRPLTSPLQRPSCQRRLATSRLRSVEMLSLAVELMEIHLQPGTRVLAETPRPNGVPAHAITMSAVMALQLIDQHLVSLTCAVNQTDLMELRRVRGMVQYQRERTALPKVDQPLGSTFLCT